MRKTIFILALFLTAKSTLHAQIDVGASPVPLIALGLAASVEYPLNPSFGLEGYLITFPVAGFFAGYVGPKHYLRPKRGNDGFSIGLFAGGGSRMGSGLGFNVGYKTVSERGFILDFGFGMGRTLFGGSDISALTGFRSVEITPYLKLNVGYRFPKKEG
ncbi:hypothetical protein [Phaeodactylibacter xiamenensis]|uniref:hypothetical protein n=1 Tax=Phaeodactylibacter xiamenensis TaxID=1524460 RepID=UPI003CCB7DA5